MPDYRQWNTALIEHVTHGAPLGSTIYLEVSEDTLTRIGVQRWGPPKGAASWRGDFLAAVQESTVARGRVSLEWMLEEEQERPPGVAFLGAMVLAASNMAEDAAQAVHARNYFRRLAEVLGLSLEAQGRPPGLPAGAEEPLWRAWLAFLRSRGYDSTARGGEGPQRFTAYPISQTLIPAAERQRLFRLFSERAYPATWDGETLASRLRADGVTSTKLRELLGRTGAAAEDVQSALQEQLQAFHASSGPEGNASGMGAAFSTRQLLAGLYREEHWRTGEPEYRLFPRQPRGVRLTDMTVEVEGAEEELVVERPGYYRPLGEVMPDQLSAGGRYAVRGSAFVDALVLPARQHWLLRPDPDSAGMYASLGTPGVGEHFLLLVHKDLLPDVQRFREEDLLKWSGEPTQLGSGWVELHDVMVIGNHWAEVSAGKAGTLHEALRPAGGVSVHVEGGVRTQRAGAYLVGGSPRIGVTSFFTEAFLTVCRDGREVFSGAVAPGEPLPGLLDRPGEYELVAQARGTRAVRLVSVMAWEDLQAASVPIDVTYATEVGSWNVLGAYVLAK